MVEPYLSKSLVHFCPIKPQYAILPIAFEKSTKKRKLGENMMFEL